MKWEPTARKAMTTSTSGVGKRPQSKWFEEEGLNKSLFVTTFSDQITGRPMYDIAFQYTPYWEEKARRSK